MDVGNTEKTLLFNAKTQICFWNLISSLRLNEKPCFNTNSNVSSESWFGSIYRCWYGESRWDCLNRIKKSLNLCNKFIDYKREAKLPYNGRYNKVTHKEIVLLSLSLYKARNGLENLIKIYNDNVIVKEFEMCLRDLDELIAKYREYIATMYYFKKDPRNVYIKCKINKSKQVSYDIHTHTYLKLKNKANC